jgi:hypothetical protein
VQPARAAGAPRAEIALSPRSDSRDVSVTSRVFSGAVKISKRPSATPAIPGRVH